MLDDNFKKITKEQIALAFADQDDQINRDVLAGLNEFTRRGIIQSSMAARQVGVLHGNDIRIRGEIALNRAKRVISMLGISATEDFETELRTFLEELLNAEVAKQRRYLNGRPPLKQPARGAGTSFHQIGNAEFGKAVDLMFRKLRSEITLYTATLRNPAKAISSGPPSITIEGDVGVFQTGSQASVTISIDAFAKEQIIKALDTVHTGLAGIKDTASFSVAEIEEMVVESKEELQKEKPNSTKLKTMLTGISGAIQTTAALRPAYESVKSVLAFLGISLP
ncbi:MAG: hypothetical protein HYW28_07650 [Rhodospirillales bacterium]|nr:hypothetical protein [Rhodospirillales bacterium]